MNVPCGAANFAVDPLYKKVVLQGDSLADANFDTGIVAQLNYRRYFDRICSAEAVIVYVYINFISIQKEQLAEDRTFVFHFHI